jgi:uncharacterized protein
MMSALGDLMTRFFTFFLFSFFLIGTLSAELSVPSNKGDRVVDKAGILSSSGVNRVDAAIRQMEHATKGQMAVLIIPSLKGDSLEEYSMRVAEKWKVGHKGQDNGLILLISKNDRKIRLEIGYGWEGKINDARAGDIIRGMQQYFRSGRFADGIIYAVGKAQEFITGKSPGALVSPPDRSPGGEGNPINLIVVIIIILVVLYLIFTGRDGWLIIFFGGGGYRGGGGGFSSGGGSFGGGGGSFGGGGGSFGGGSFGGGGASGGW